MYGTRVDRTQHPVEVETVAVVGSAEALRQHDLEDVAGRDVLLGRTYLLHELLARGLRREWRVALDAHGSQLCSARALIDAAKVLVDAAEGRIVGRSRCAARPHRRDDLHHAARVVEGDHDVREHEDHVGYVELVGVMPRNLVESAGSLVAEKPDRAAHEQRQPRHARHATCAQPALHDLERVVRAFPAHAAVLDTTSSPRALTTSRSPTPRKL